MYPKNPYNNVHFFYGEAQDASAADDFSVGRLWYQIDATGVQQFKYGRLGEVTYNLRSVAVPGDKAYWFKTEWEYDTWNRVKKIIYPDEEEVTYFYNRGGELHGITSKKQSQQNADIISQLGYDKFGQRTYLRYGNGTETEYSYEDNRRRLLNMTAKSNTTYGSSVNRTFINNNYSYDVLSNVLSVENTAALPTAGQIGGSVLYEYEYDDLNRLKTATGNFTGRNMADTGHEYQKYMLAMEYDNMHNILGKTQVHETSPDNTNWTKAHQTTYDLTYQEYNTAEFNVAGYSYTQPHAVRQVIDKPETTSTGNDVKTKLYDYDANGNQTAITQKTGESDAVEKLRTNLWDEENRLRAVDITPDAEGVRPIAIYTYDAGGERVLKHSNTSVSIYLNGKKVADTIQVDATLYPSGMTVFRPSFGGEGGGSYTKHYFAGTQRVSSKIGTTENLGDYLYDWFTQGTGGPIDVIGSSFGVLENAEEGVVQVYTELGIEPPVYDSNPVFIPVASFIHGGNEVEQYFFHPDHLGSTSYITNLLGEVSQHMEYFAFGETFVEEHRSSNNSPYKFNGKELDEETGWYYYGARYYDPRISIWLSVDPLAEQTMTPYQYTYQNPIRFIDPTGMEPEKIIVPNAKVKKKWDAYTNEIRKTKWGREVLNRLEKSKEVYTVTEGGVDSFGYTYDEKTRTIKMGAITQNGYNILKRDGSSLKIFSLIGHEIWHAFQHDVIGDDFIQKMGGKNNVEDQAVQFENYLNKAFGFKDIRTKYSGRDVNDPTKFARRLESDKPLEQTNATKKTQPIMSTIFIWTFNKEVPLPDE